MAGEELTLLNVQGYSKFALNWVLSLRLAGVENFLLIALDERSYGMNVPRRGAACTVPYADVPKMTPSSRSLAISAHLLFLCSIFPEEEGASLLSFVFGCVSFGCLTPPIGAVQRHHEFAVKPSVPSVPCIACHKLIQSCTTG